MPMLRLLCLFLSMLADTVSAAPSQLLIGISNSLSEPRLFRHETRSEGLVPDVARALGSALQRPVEIHLLPRKRLPIALKNGDIDGICLTNPSRPDIKQVMLHWTPVLFEDIEVIVGLGSSPPVSRLEELHGQMIGTSLGYRYPLLEDEFLSGRIQRNDAPDEALNLRKLLQGRFSYIVWKEDAARWYNKNAALGNSLVISPLVIQRASLHCAFSPHAGLSEQVLEQAAHQLDSSGTLRAILQRYR